VISRCNRFISDRVRTRQVCQRRCVWLVLYGMYSILVQGFVLPSLDRKELSSWSFLPLMSVTVSVKLLQWSLLMPATVGQLKCKAEQRTSSAMHDVRRDNPQNRYMFEGIRCKLLYSSLVTCGEGLSWVEDIQTTRKFSTPARDVDLEDIPSS